MRVDLDPTRGREQAKTRPCVVVQTDLLSRSQTTIVLPVCDAELKQAEIPFVVAVPKGEGGLTKDSLILAHQVRVVSEERLVEKLGRLSAPTMARVDAAIRFSFFGLSRDRHN